MFSSFANNKAQIHKTCEAILKLFASPTQQPKNFFKQEPIFKDYAFYFEITSFKLKTLQDIIKDKMNKPFELEITLGSELLLTKEIKKEMWEIMSILMRREKRFEQQHEDFLFQFVERLFVQVTFQIPKWVNLCNSIPNLNDSAVVDNISTTLLYFIKYQDISNPNFYDLLYSFIGLLKVQWPMIFYGNSPFLREKICQLFIWVGQLVPFECQFEKKCCFPFMTSVVLYCIDFFKDFKFKVTDIIQLQRQFIFIIDSLTNYQNKEMMELVETFLRIGPSFLRSLTNSLVNLENCLGIFQKCAPSLGNVVVIGAFQDVLEYILWFSFQFPKLHSPSPVPLVEIPTTELRGIGVPIYSKYAVVLPDSINFTLYSRFQNIPSEIAGIISENSSQKILIAVLFEFLIKYKPFFESDDYNGPVSPDSCTDSDGMDSGDKDTSEEDSAKPPNINNFQKFRSLILVVLEVARNLKIPLTFDFLFENFEQFKNGWVPIIINYIFPIEQEKINQGSINLYCSIIFNCFRDLADKRKLLLNEISHLIDTRCNLAPNSEKSLMIEFLPLLNSILMNSLYENDIINSNILKTFIRESKKDVRVFDLFSNIIFVYPVQCFTSSQLTGFITEYFDDDVFHNSFVRCLVNGLYFCGKQKDSNEIRLLFNHLSAMLPTLFSKKYQRCYDLIDMLAKTLPSFEVENFSLFFKTRIIDLVASSCASVLSKRMFESAFNLFTIIGRINNQSLLKISSPKSTIYSIFSQIFENNTFDFDIVKWLFMFAIIPKDFSKYKLNDYKRTILNPMALVLIFKWIAGRKNEAEIVQHLFLMAESHVVNVYQMQKAHVPSLILDRVSKVIDDDSLAQNYYDLLYSIWRQGVPSSDIYKAVSVMKTCKNPHMITDTINRLLRQEKTKHSVLYYLHGKSSSSGFTFHGINRDKPLDTLVVTMSILPDSLGTAKSQVLLYIQNEKNDFIEFGIEKETIYCLYNKYQKQYFQTNLIQNLWYNLTFIINAKCIKLIIIDIKQNQANIERNKTDSVNETIQKQKKKIRPKSFMDKKANDLNAPFFDKESFSCPNFFTQSIKLRIGRGNLPSNFYTGFISFITIFDDYVPNEDYTYTSMYSSSKLQSHALYILNPRKTRLKESGIMLRRESYFFVGMTFGVFCTIHSTIEDTNLMDNMLPLYKRLSSCDSCQNSTQYCNLCNRLNQKTGQLFLVSLTSLIIKFLEMPKITKSNESPKNIIVLFSQFFTATDTIFFTDNFVNTFYAIFDYTQNSNTGAQVDTIRKVDLGKKMVELIWLNYEMVSRFPVELQLHYFSLHLMKVFVDDEKSDIHLFKSFASYDFLIHKLLLYFTDGDNEVTKIAWQITLECFIKKAITTATASALLGLSFSTETMAVSDPIVSFIEMLTKTGHSTMTAANQSFSSLIPYAIWASRPPVLVQRKVILFIKNNMAKKKTEAETALFCAAFLYEAPNRGVDLVEFVTYFIGVGRKSFYPLFARVMANITKDDFEKHKDIIFLYLSPEKSGGVENIIYWLVMIAQSIVFLNIQEGIVKLCEDIFGQLIINNFAEKKYDMLNIMIYYVTLFSIENDINMDILIDTTIEFLINYYNQRKKEKTNEISAILFAAAFTQLFIKNHYDVSFSKENNIFTVYADHICTFTVNFTITADLKESLTTISEINLALQLVQYMSSKPFQVNLFGVEEMSSTELIAYTLLKLCNTPDINNIIKVKSIDDLVKKFVSSLSGHSQSNDNSKLIIANYKCKATDKLNKPANADPSSFLSAFEESLKSLFPTYSQNLHKNCEKIITEIRNYMIRKMDLNIDSKPPDPQKAQKLDYFTYAINTDSFKMLFNMYKKYRQSMTEKSNLSKSINAKVLTVFMRNLQVRCGPWFKPGETNYHFKCAKLTGKTGYRSLMKINTQFDVNKTSATIEDKLKPLAALPTGSIGFPTHMITPRCIYIGNLYKCSKSLLFVGEFTNVRKRRVEIYYKSIVYVFTRILANGAEGCEIFLENSKSYLFAMPSDCRDVLFKYIDEFHSSLPLPKLAMFLPGTSISQNSSSNSNNTNSSLNNNNNSSNSSNNSSNSNIGISTNFNGEKYNFFRALERATGSIVQRVPSTELFTMMRLSEVWENRMISNYAYIYFLNLLAGRSFNDLSQYPVYPWVLSDYMSERLNFTTPEAFRDLSKSTCNLHKPFQFNVTGSQVTSHFSNPYIVLNYLRLLEPFASIGKSYKANDLSPPIFTSISETWDSVRNMKGDNRELIPEFFTNDFFLIQDDNNKIGLPQWANNDPANFVRIHRAALESEYVRHNLPKWIDLMFGVNINSADCFNQYPNFSYHGQLSKDHKSACFGICPQQVLLQPQSRPSLPSIEFREISPFPVKNVVRIRKGIVLTEDFTVISASDVKRPIPVPPLSNVKFLEVSKSTQTVFYASPFECYFTGFRICNNVLRPVMINHDAALIQAIAVIGPYVVSGSIEGSIKRWSLPSFCEHLMTNFHCCPVIALSGSATLNLIVSLDTNSQLVYETISSPIFLRAVKLEFEAAVKNFIAVFKCGIIAVVQSGSEESVITLLDLSGTVLNTRKYPAYIQECDKMMSKSRSAILFVGYSSDTIEMLELPSLKTTKSYHGLIPNMRFCVSKGAKNEVEAFTGTEIKLLSLSSNK